MQTIFNLFLVLHIIGGASGLIIGSINIARKKGDKLHRKLGKLFLYGMLTAGASALVLSILHPNHFLFIVGIFTIYLTATGQRYLSFKQKNNTPGTIDWMLSLGMLLTGIVFIVLGATQLYSSNNFGIVYLVFGLIGLRFFNTDRVNYKGKSNIKNYWLTGHLQRMTASYIAALTAFLVVNGKYLPDVLPSFAVWLLPTVLLVPLIFIWSRKYQTIV